MIRRFLAIAVLVAVIAATLAPLAAEASPRRAHQSGLFSSCEFAIKYTHGPMSGDRVVYLVRTESQTQTPATASTELVNRIEYIYREGCGDALDYYVTIRVDSAGDAYYYGVIAYWGID